MEKLFKRKLRGKAPKMYLILRRLTNEHGIIRGCGAHHFDYETMSEIQNILKEIEGERN